MELRIYQVSVAFVVTVLQLLKKLLAANTRVLVFEARLTNLSVQVHNHENA